MQAIILAAGMGRRLGELTNDNTKCMLQVNGVRLIHRILDSIYETGIRRVVLVVGYKAENVKSLIGDEYRGMEIIYVENSVYDKTNNIYSLFLAREYLTADDTILLESDLIFESDVLKKIINDPYPTLALVDKYESWMDGTVVTLDEDNNIVEFLTKDKFKYSDISSYYKTVNIYKFSKDFSETHYVPFLEAYCHALGNNEYYEQVLKVITLLDDSPLKALPLDGERWYEIDDIQDLDIASGMFEKSDELRYKAMTSRYGGYWRYPHMLDFCYLVNPYFPNQRMRDELSASFNRLLTEYPSGQRVNSLLAAKDFGVKQDYMVVGNGAAELIKVLFEQVLGKVGVVRPTFEEYPNRMMPEQIVAYETTAPDFSYTADELMTYFEDKKIWSLVLINPDNPTGNYIPYSDCMRLAQWCQERNIIFILDESFIDFSTEHPTFISNEILEQYSNLVVIKSISKSYGVPGLRLGILATSNAMLMANLRRSVSIWNINSFAEFFLQILGKYERPYQQAMDDFRTERTRFVSELQSINYLRVVPSEANYLLCEVLPPHTPRELAIQLLKKYNILIKDCTSKCHAPYIRIAVRDAKDNNQLIAALRTL